MNSSLFNICIQIVGFPDVSDLKESASKAGDWGLIPDWLDPLENRMAIIHPGIRPYECMNVGRPLFLSHSSSITTEFIPARKPWC